MFEDIPLDNRHWKVKSKPKFPEEWRLTDERKKELEAYRRQGELQDPGHAETELGRLGEPADPDRGQGQQQLDEALTVPVKPAPRTPAGL